MGAHPKNKITRAERGKRRAGNTPSLKKDYRIKTVPLHKRGLVNTMLSAMGLIKSTEKTEKSEEHKKATVQPSVKPVPAASKPARATTSVPKTNVKRTQHKG